MAPARGVANGHSRHACPNVGPAGKEPIADLIHDSQGTQSTRDWELQVEILDGFTKSLQSGLDGFQLGKALLAAGASLPGGRSEVQKAVLTFIMVRHTLCVCGSRTHCVCMDHARRQRKEACLPACLLASCAIALVSDRQQLWRLTA
jgi:hypothetical protein